MAKLLIFIQEAVLLRSTFSFAVVSLESGTMVGNVVGRVNH